MAICNIFYDADTNEKRMNFKFIHIFFPILRINRSKNSNLTPQRCEMLNINKKLNENGKESRDNTRFEFIMKLVDKNK